MSGLPQAWRDAWARTAASRDRSRPVAVTIPIEGPDVRFGGRFRFAFESDAVSLRAGGAARWVRGPDPKVVGEQAQRLLAAAGALGPPAAPGPLAVGGWAFEPERVSAAWAGLGGASLVVPRVLVRSGFATLWLEPGEEPGAFAESDQIWLCSPGSGEGRVGSVPDIQRGSRDRFESVVRTAVERIRAGELTKVVASRRTRLLGRFSAEQVASRLRRPDGRSARFTVGFGERTFLGATPELLARRLGGRAETEALAGSAPPTEGESLLRSGKDLDEHRRVVEHVRRVVSARGATALHAPDPRLRDLGYVTHLWTPIAIEGRADLDAWRWGAALHPTPAIGGWPAAEALALIRATEPEGRGWYGGAVGWLDAAGDGELYVALRSALIEPDGATLFVGVGLVEESDPAREWSETLWKERAMLQAFGASDAVRADPS